MNGPVGQMEAIVIMLRAKPAFLDVFAALLVIEFCAAPSAHAYIDPGTGSFILQALSGAAFAAFLAIKVFWFRIKAFFARLFKRKDHSQD
jgi:hypothetical protein